jgi:hypothetical protein
MSELNNNGPTLDQYLEATSDAASRSRSTIIFMVLACILALIGFWNQQKTAWLTLRIQAARNALDWIAFPDDTTDNAVFIKYLSAAHQLEITKLRDSLLPLGLGLKAPDRALLNDLDSARTYFNDKDNLDNIIQSIKYINLTQFRSKERLSKRLEFLERNHIENETRQSVIFLGISFDINDLGPFAGITFFAILTLLIFCLQRELDNLRILFKKTKLEDTYHLLAMKQIFTIPRQEERSKDNEAYFKDYNRRGQPKLLPYVTILVLALILINDILSHNSGYALGVWRTNLTFGLTAIFLSFNIYLSIRASRLLWSIHEAWENEAKSVFDKNLPCIELPKYKKLSWFIKTAALNIRKFVSRYSNQVPISPSSPTPPATG